MRIIEKKETILEYGKDTDNIELYEFREGIEIRINGHSLILVDRTKYGYFLLLL
jgi:hypothetical protein